MSWKRPILAACTLAALALAVLVPGPTAWPGIPDSRPASNAHDVGLSIDPSQLVAWAPDLPRDALAPALRAYERARQGGMIDRAVLSIVDYALPSTAKRLWVLDLDAGRVLFNELVAHGRQSGDDHAVAFSNELGSRQSSLGAFVTGTTYVGRHGVSLRLRGLEPGINDRAEERTIVLHGAPYVSEDYARRFGRIGRSLGCPAVRPEVADSLIETIRDGTLFFAYYPDSSYAARSAYVGVSPSPTFE
jgi:L,D-transpeptidase-like protein